MRTNINLVLTLITETSVGTYSLNPLSVFITNLQVSWVCSKLVQNLLFHRFVLFKHKSRV